MSAPATPLVIRWHVLAQRYLTHLEAGDEAGAVRLVTELVQAQAPPEQVLLEVIAATQARVGQLWAEDRWSVAREHAATAISERAVAALSMLTGPALGYRGRITVACVDGEWHALPARILSEVLRLRGWRTDYLGANVPGRHLVTHLQQTDADAVALSCMLPSHLPRAHAAITAAQAAGVPVIAGGAGFGADGERARVLGADAWAPTATAAVDRLAASDWPPPVGVSPQVGAPPPEVRAGGEYAWLSQRRPALLDAAMRRLPAEYPPAGGYSQRQRDATAADLGQIVDFLTAALYLDDPTIFTDFVGWTSRVLAARNVPGAALRAGLETLHRLLPDCPRAGEILREGAAAVDAAALTERP